MVIVRRHVKDYSWGTFHHCFDHRDHNKQHSFSLLTIKTLVFNFVFQMDGWGNRSIHLTIAGLHVTSRRSRWMSRTKALLSSENLTLFSCKFFQKNSVVLSSNMAALSRGCKPRIYFIWCRNALIFKAY